MSDRIPVTVLTGFLGSGKTTLLNRILSEQHGKRIAVIENEFGEVGVDHELVIGAQEEIFETANGCICCTVRGDLIRVLGQLRKRRERFDYILIETTGLADPGPVAQSFFVDEDLKEDFELDAVVTLVDAAHITRQLEESPTAADQIAFGDVLVLNKTDLVEPAALARIEQTLRAINGTARIVRTERATLPLDQVLDVGAFDLDRALSVNAAFLETPRPFEWAGLYRLPAGHVALHTGAHEHAHAHEHEHGPEHEHAHEHEAGHDHGHDPDRGAEEAPAHGHAALAAVSLLVLPAPGSDEAALEQMLELATRTFDDTARPAARGAHLAPGALYQLQLGHSGYFELALPKAGHWIVFTEHHPGEFGFHVHGEAPLLERAFGSHHHDAEIGSIGISDERALDPNQVNDWLSYLLQSRGADILRMKGVLSFKGEARRYVFHGVHMIFEGKLERAWGEQPRVNRLVFIGRNLDRQELEAGFASCIA
jgi:G3E family GTPase